MVACITTCCLQQSAALPSVRPAKAPDAAHVGAQRAPEPVTGTKNGTNAEQPPALASIITATKPREPRIASVHCSCKVRATQRENLPKVKK